MIMVVTSQNYEAGTIRLHITYGDIYIYTKICTYIYTNLNMYIHIHIVYIDPTKIIGRNLNDSHGNSQRGIY